MSYGGRSWQERQRRARKVNMMNKVTWFTLFAIVAVVVLGSGGLYLTTKHTETCTVASKERTTHVSDGTSTQQKLVYTNDCGTFTVDDAWYQGKFNSADTYGMLKDGKTYTLTVMGWRNGFFSWFPNILSAQEVG